VKRGEIWLVDFNPGFGSEMAKRRPAVIVSADYVGILPLKVVVPITDWNDRYYQYSWMVYIAPCPDNGLNKIGGIDCLNVRSVSTEPERFIRKLGQVDANTMADVLAAIAIVLDLP
jgi:mRNA interferase MazF